MSHSVHNVNNNNCRQLNSL